MIIVKFNPTTFIAICSFWLNVVFPFAPTGFWRLSRSNGITIMWRVASRGSAAPRFWRLCAESTSSREERSLISQVSTFLHIMMIFFYCHISFLTLWLFPLASFWFQIQSFFGSVCISLWLKQFAGKMIKKIEILGFGQTLRVNAAKLTWLLISPRC